jgi:outer membrane lipoprotein carrier protein
MSCGRLKLALLPAGVALLAGLCRLDAAILTAPAPGDGPSPPMVLSQVLRGVENKYNAMRSMKAHFEQVYRQGGRVMRQEQGELYLSKPGRMRWEYQTPEPKLFVTDGRQVILFVPSENRVTEAAIKESDDIRAPLRFLLGRLKFSEEFDRMETSPELAPAEAGNFVFKAYSKKLAEQLEWIIFEISPSYEIRRVVTREPGGLETEFRFDHLEPNPPLADSIFRFSPPAGAEVVRQ